MMKKKYTEEDLIVALNDSISIRQILIKLGLSTTGGSNYTTIKKHIEYLNLDTSHMMGQKWNKGKIFPYTPKIHIDDILIDNSNYNNTTNLKKRLLKEGLLINKCDRCGINEWIGEKLSLHLEHRNGNRNDNRIENICLLCPNCHSLTKTYCGKNKNRYVKKNKKYSLDGILKNIEKNSKLKKCDNEKCNKKHYNKRFCSIKCSNIFRTKNNKPQRWKLIEEIKKYSRLYLSKKYGVSDNTIKDWAIDYGIEIKPLRLNDNDIIEIREKYKQGNISYNDLAKQYSRNKTSIIDIVNYKSYKNVCGDGVTEATQD